MNDQPFHPQKIQLTLPKSRANQIEEKISRALTRASTDNKLASCATLWRLFPTRDREHELSFLLLFVFSLRKEKKRKK
jgi:hypothetical protein